MSLLLLISLRDFLTERALTRTRGQGLVEYSLIIALVSVVVIAALVLLGGQVNHIFHNVANNL